MPADPLTALIAIPALNEAGLLTGLLEQLQDRKEQVLVIDDGSTDDTAAVARKAGFPCISHPSNLGLARVYETASGYAVSHRFTHVISLDGDGQHDPGYIPRFLEALLHNDFVSGNRFHHPDVIPESKLASNLLAILLFREALGITLPDVACGFRGWRSRDPVLSGLTMPEQLASPYGIVFGMLLWRLLTGKPVGTVDIPAIYPSSEPLNTRIRELTGLVSVIHSYRPSATTKTLLNRASLKQNIRISVAGVPFEGIFEPPDAYCFLTDPNRARDFFRSLHPKHTHDHQG